MKKFVLIVFAAIQLTGLLLVNYQFATAAGAEDACNGSASSSAYCQGKGTANENALAKTIGKVTNFIALLSGFIAVIFVIVGGYKFVLSGGDPQKAASGRMTVLYAVIGLVVVVSAAEIISLVLKQL